MSNLSKILIISEVFLPGVKSDAFHKADFAVIGVVVHSGYKKQQTSKYFTIKQIRIRIS